MSPIGQVGLIVAEFIFVPEELLRWFQPNFLASVIWVICATSPRRVSWLWLKIPIAADGVVGRAIRLMPDRFGFVNGVQQLPKPAEVPAM